MTASDVPGLVRKYFASYEARDRGALESLLTDDFTFCSPRDDHIDRSAYFRRCWPFSEQVSSFRIERLFAEGNEAFVQYLCRPRSGQPFRNTEFMRVRSGQIVEVVVYFGAGNGHEQRPEA